MNGVPMNNLDKVYDMLERIEYSAYTRESAGI